MSVPGDGLPESFVVLSGETAAWEAKSGTVVAPLLPVVKRGIIKVKKLIVGKVPACSASAKPYRVSNVKSNVVLKEESRI